MIDRLRFLSPAVLMQDALNDVAGSGTPRHRHFLEQVDRYHARWRGFVVPLIFEKARVMNPAIAPHFDYREEQLGAVARRVLIVVLGLLVPAFVMLGVGISRLDGYPVVG